MAGQKEGKGRGDIEGRLVSGEGRKENRAWRAVRVMLRRRDWEWGRLEQTASQWTGKNAE